jgi:hypothetical protein
MESGGPRDRGGPAVIIALVVGIRLLESLDLVLELSNNLRPSGTKFLHAAGVRNVLEEGSEVLDEGGGLATQLAAAMEGFGKAWDLLVLVLEAGQDVRPLSQGLFEFELGRIRFVLARTSRLRGRLKSLLRLDQGSLSLNDLLFQLANDILLPGELH